MFLLSQKVIRERVNNTVAQGFDKASQGLNRMQQGLSNLSQKASLASQNLRSSDGEPLYDNNEPVMRGGASGMIVSGTIFALSALALMFVSGALEYRIGYAASADLKA